MLAFVVEDDKRGSELSQLLLNKGYYVSDDLKDLKYADIIYLGLKGIDNQYRLSYKERLLIIDECTLKNLKSDCCVFTIVFNPFLKKLSDEYSFHYFSLLSDIHFINFNSIMSAEGLISYMIYKLNKPIYCSSILILGYGKCSRAIAPRLISFDCFVSIGARNKNLKGEIEEKGYKFIELNNINLEDYDIVINTIPSVIIDKNMLDKSANKPVLFDIASFPYGIDHHEAIRLGYDSFIVSSIPGHFYPFYSAKLISEYIIEKSINNA